MKMGDMVRWYPQADRTTKYSALALVTEVYPNGACSLAIIPPDAKRGDATLMMRPAIHHIDDPYLIDKPELRNRDGAWDYIDVAEKPAKSPATTRKTAKDK